jgi:ribosomal protein S3
VKVWIYKGDILPVKEAEKAKGFDGKEKASA